MIRRAFLFVCLLMMPLFAVNAVQAAEGVGSAIPHDLALKNQHGEDQSFDTLKGDKGLVLVFIRSADWCPYCQAQLIDLGQTGHEIENLGYGLAILSYDSVDALMTFTKKYDYQYTLLSDPNSEAIKAFGILNEDMNPGSAYYGIPHPGIYVIGTNKVIQAKLFEKGYQNRPPIDQITAAIKGVSGF